MGDGVERFAKVEYCHVNLVVPVKPGCDVLLCYQELRFTGVLFPEAVL